MTPEFRWWSFHFLLNHKNDIHIEGILIRMTLEHSSFNFIHNVYYPEIYILNATHKTCLLCWPLKSCGKTKQTIFHLRTSTHTQTLTTWKHSLKMKLFGLVLNTCLTNTNRPWAQIHFSKPKQKRKRFFLCVSVFGWAWMGIK